MGSINDHGNGNGGGHGDYSMPVNIETKEEANDRRSMRQVAVADLIHQCNVAQRTMAQHNPNRTLLLNCAYAMKQMVTRIGDLEKTIEGALATSPIKAVPVKAK